MFHHCPADSRWHRLPRPLRIAGHVFLGILLAAGFAFVFGYLTMVLWNAILPDISSLPPLTFWQAAGLLLLARLMTGRFSHGPGRRGFGRRHRNAGPEVYAEWWQTEGEASFNAFARRRVEPRRGDVSHEQ